MLCSPEVCLGRMIKLLCIFILTVLHYLYMNDDRLKDAKIFNQIRTPIAITKDGYIGINPFSESVVIFHIQEVIEYGFNQIQDDSSSKYKKIATGSLIGAGIGLLLGALNEAGKGNVPSKSGIPSMMIGAGVGGTVKHFTMDNQNNISLIFKRDDFDNPIITVPLLVKGIDKSKYKEIQDEIIKLKNTLDYLWNKRMSLTN